jgi:hypothetical protein
MIASLGARVHLFVHPQLREAFTALFKDVLGCDVLERDFGLPYPILFVPFPDGSGFSVEFREKAQLTDDPSYSTWVEFRTPNIEEAHRKLRDAGIREFRHPGSSHVYFSAPGGQVFRLLDIDYKGP